MCDTWVTSHVEVWIETTRFSAFGTIHVSPPTWRCGLKLLGNANNGGIAGVTSHVEVWIETKKRAVYSQY